MSLLVVVMTLIGCSEYDNGYTPKDIEFTRDFSREFGTFDYPKIRKQSQWQSQLQ